MEKIEELVKLNKIAHWVIDFYNDTSDFADYGELLDSVNKLIKGLRKECGVDHAILIIQSIIISYDGKDTEFISYFEEVIKQLEKNELNRICWTCHKKFKTNSFTFFCNKCKNKVKKIIKDKKNV